jgi:hypothetical protein
VLYVGRAQEKARVVRTERRRSATTGATCPSVVDGSAMVNHCYFYCVDSDFGPFFLKFCSYFLYNAKLCINGNEYAKCQLRKRGIAFEALDNGVLSCADPKALQRICDGLDDKKIDHLLRKWLARLPHPFDRHDRAAGYRSQASILQAEFALTQVLDRPVAGRPPCPCRIAAHVAGAALNRHAPSAAQAWGLSGLPATARPYASSAASSFTAASASSVISSSARCMSFTAALSCLLSSFSLSALEKAATVPKPVIP